MLHFGTVLGWSCKASSHREQFVPPFNPPHNPIIFILKVFAVFWAVIFGAMRLGQALPQMGVIVGAKLAAGEMFSIIDRKPALDATTSAGMKLEKVEGRIEFGEVHFAYPTRPTQPILKGVSFGVEPGQSIALVGHSGCGKSTMVGLLMRFYDCQRGSVTLDGVGHWIYSGEWN